MLRNVLQPAMPRTSGHYYGIMKATASHTAVSPPKSPLQNEEPKSKKRSERLMRCSSISVYSHHRPAENSDAAAVNMFFSCASSLQRLIRPWVFCHAINKPTFGGLSSFVQDDNAAASCKITPRFLASQRINASQIVCCSAMHAYVVGPMSSFELRCQTQA